MSNPPDSPIDPDLPPTTPITPTTPVGPVYPVVPVGGAARPTDPTSPGGGGRGWRTAAIILAIIVGIAVVVAITLAVIAATRPAPAPTPTETASPMPSPTATPTPTPTVNPALCAVSELTVTLGRAEGAAGSTILPVIFTNVGGRSCTLEGYPGVSLVADEFGSPIGAPAAEDASTPGVRQTLEPGGKVSAKLKITQAANVDNCTPQPANGLRVYPPGSTGSAFVATTDYPGCANAAVSILTVGVVVAGTP